MDFTRLIRNLGACDTVCYESVEHSESMIMRFGRSEKGEITGIVGAWWTEQE